MSEEAIELAPIDVRVTEPFLESNGFYRRSGRRLGRQYSRAQLDELSILEVSDAVRLSPGVSLGYDPSLPTRVIASSPRTGASRAQVCPLTVFVDGVRTLDPDVNQVPSDWLAAMEIYLGAEAPAQYRVPGGCGVVLLWTKQKGGA